MPPSTNTQEPKPTILNPQPQSPFFALLPRELRDEIYALLIPDLQISKFNLSSIDLTSPATILQPICHLFRLELRDAIARHSTLLLADLARTTSIFPFRPGEWAADLACTGQICASCPLAVSFTSIRRASPQTPHEPDKSKSDRTPIIRISACACKSTGPLTQEIPIIHRDDVARLMKLCYCDDRVAPIGSFKRGHVRTKTCPWPKGFPLPNIGTVTCEVPLYRAPKERRRGGVFGFVATIIHG